MDRSPKWLVPVAIAAVLWNLLGCMAFIADLRLTPQDVAHMSPAQQHLYATRPMWSVAGTGVAVVGGVLGSVALALRRRIAVGLLVVSLAGVLMQDVGIALAYGAMPGATVVVLQGLVFAIAVALVALARRYATR